MYLCDAHACFALRSDERYPHDQVVRMGTENRQAVGPEARGGAGCHPQEPHAGNVEQHVQVSRSHVVEQQEDL